MFPESPQKTPKRIYHYLLGCGTCAELVLAHPLKYPHLYKLLQTIIIPAGKSETDSDNQSQTLSDTNRE